MAQVGVTSSIESVSLKLSFEEAQAVFQAIEYAIAQQPRKDELWRINVIEIRDLLQEYM